MELELKLPKGKPPFIGVRFQSNYQAYSLNRDLIINYSTNSYNIVLEPNGTMLNLILINRDNGIKRIYEALDFNKERLLKYLSFTKGVNQFNFGHIIRKHDTDEVVRVSETMQLFVLKVVSISLYEN